jgi:Flp pilus assembly protein TadD
MVIVALVATVVAVAGCGSGSGGGESQNQDSAATTPDRVSSHEACQTAESAARRAVEATKPENIGEFESRDTLDEAYSTLVNLQSDDIEVNAAITVFADSVGNVQTENTETVDDLRFDTEKLHRLTSAMREMTAAIGQFETVCRRVDARDG